MYELKYYFRILRVSQHQIESMIQGLKARSCRAPKVNRKQSQHLSHSRHLTVQCRHDRTCSKNGTDSHLMSGLGLSSVSSQCYLMLIHPNLLMCLCHNLSVSACNCSGSALKALGAPTLTTQSISIVCLARVLQLAACLFHYCHF